MKLDARTGFSVRMDCSAVTMKASETLRGVDDSAPSGFYLGNVGYAGLNLVSYVN